MRQRMRPVRRIRANNRSFTGRVSRGPGLPRVDVESHLEAELTTLLRADWRVESFGAQPLRIDYVDASGVDRSYTPDFLVRLNRARVPADWPDLLIEVKYFSDLRRNIQTWRAPFAAARRYAAAAGLRFLVVTDRAIHGPALKAARRLNHHRHDDPDPAREALLVERLRDAGTATFDALRTSVAVDDGDDRDVCTAVLVSLIANGRILAPPGRELTPQTPLWLPE